MGEEVKQSDLIDEIRTLAELMLEVAVKLDYFGGLNKEICQHASELAMASAIALTWADGMEGGE